MYIMYIYIYMCMSSHESWLWGESRRCDDPVFVPTPVWKLSIISYYEYATSIYTPPPINVYSVYLK